MARKKKKKSRDGSQGRLVLTFDEENRQDFLTGFHKRKVERRKVALEEIQKKLKEEQRKLREERHKRYLKILRERRAALEEVNELDQLVTSKTECVQYDHPNHTVTVTSVSNLDLSEARRLGLSQPGGGRNPEAEEMETSVEQPSCALPKKSRYPFLSQRISSLTASLHARSQKQTRKKHPKPHRGRDPAKKPLRATRTSKTHRRRMTGKARGKRNRSPR
ncbi:nucleolar protein 12 [Gracilinanus agilis]|uniref:nucleolar protein 12 n=1 Tax=Gracilinanus agilis TaxID=191870 RepID=UPI001CFECCD7|nr:nucleolar protein 12 [Gracilinanus agilis]